MGIESAPCHSGGIATHHSPAYDLLTGPADGPRYLSSRSSSRADSAREPRPRLAPRKARTRHHIGPTIRFARNGPPPKRIRQRRSNAQSEPYNLHFRPADTWSEQASDERHERYSSIRKCPATPTPHVMHTHKTAGQRPLAADSRTGNVLHLMRHPKHVEILIQTINLQVRHPSRPAPESPRTPRGASSGTDRTPAAPAPCTRPPGSTPGPGPALPGRTRRTRYGGRPGPTGA